MDIQNIDITIIQTALHWEDKSKNLEMFSRKLDSIDTPTDIIVLPEMFNTGFTMNAHVLAEKMKGKTIHWMQKKAGEKNATIAGSLIVEEDGKYYNRLLWVEPDGHYNSYDKRHLFRMADENNYYASGERKLIAKIKGWKICPLICYDLRFPVWSRNRLRNGMEYDYDILICIANWPEKRNHAWKTLLMARAIENQCFVVGVNRIGKDGNDVSYSGDSMVVNPKGEIISSTKPHEENIETINISYKELAEFRESFPVGLDADEFSVKEKY